MLSARLAASVARSLPRTAQKVSESQQLLRILNFFHFDEMENCITTFQLLRMKYA